MYAYLQQNNTYMFRKKEAEKIEAAQKNKIGKKRKIVSTHAYAFFFSAVIQSSLIH
jgi:hypothetical protein